MEFTQRQLEDSQAVVMDSVRSLQMLEAWFRRRVRQLMSPCRRIERELSWNRDLEQKIANLRNQSCQIADWRSDAERQFMSVARHFTTRDLNSKTIPEMRVMVQKALPASRKKVESHRKSLHRRERQLRRLQKQRMMYQRDLNRTISERDAIYHHFANVIASLSLRNRRLEIEIDEHIRNLCQSVDIRKREFCEQPVSPTT